MADAPALPTNPDEILPPKQEFSSFVLAAKQDSGPLPSIEEIRQWEEVLPGAAERFLALLEQQTQSEIENDGKTLELQRDVIRWNFRLLTTGQIFGFIIAMTAILSGASLVYSGHDVAGTIMSGTGIGSLGGLFLYSRRRDTEKKEPSEQ